MQIVGRAIFAVTVRTVLRGSGIGLVAAVAIPASPAFAQIVKVGTQTVAVPSSGQIVVDGQTISVAPGATRVLLAAPPAGSTAVVDGGQTDYQLPPGATGAAFTYPSANTDAVTIPSTAVYSSPSPEPAATPADSSPTCEVTPYTPGVNGGQATVRGTSLISCSGENAELVEVQSQSTLYWESIDGGGWVWQGYALSPWGFESEDVTFLHACTRGTTNYWKTRAGGTSIYEGIQVSYGYTGSPALLICT